jgi:hypothetical protein
LAVPLPASGEQIKKLGIRLASGDPISAEDDHAPEELVTVTCSRLELARPRLNGLAEAVGTPPLHITARAKTTGTIIESCAANMDVLARMGDLRLPDRRRVRLQWP